MFSFLPEIALFGTITVTNQHLMNVIKRFAESRTNTGTHLGYICMLRFDLKLYIYTNLGCLCYSFAFFKIRELEHNLQVAWTTHKLIPINFY